MDCFINNTNKMNIEFDKVFERINSLTWLPFIGTNYCKQSKGKKTLIVGESHYFRPTEKNSLEKHLIPSFTREIVQEMGFDREYWGIKLFPNFHRTMMGNDTFDTNVFWNNYSFYNFIQRPLNMNKIERPQKVDFDNAWDTFNELLPILNPDRVLFLGNSAAERFKDFSIRNDVKIEDIKWIKKIGRAYAKRAFIYNQSSKIQIDFIKHPSQYFSWETWREYLFEIELAR